MRARSGRALWPVVVAALLVLLPGVALAGTAPGARPGAATVSCGHAAPDGAQRCALQVAPSAPAATARPARAGTPLRLLAAGPGRGPTAPGLLPGSLEPALPRSGRAPATTVAPGGLSRRGPPAPAEH